MQKKKELLKYGFESQEEQIFKRIQGKYGREFEKPGLQDFPIERIPKEFLDLNEFENCVHQIATNQVDSRMEYFFQKYFIKKT